MISSLISFWVVGVLVLLVIYLLLRSTFLVFSELSWAESGAGSVPKTRVAQTWHYL